MSENNPPMESGGPRYRSVSSQPDLSSGSPPSGRPTEALSSERSSSMEKIASEVLTSMRRRSAVSLSGTEFVRNGNKNLQLDMTFARVQSDVAGARHESLTRAYTDRQNAISRDLLGIGPRRDSSPTHLWGQAQSFPRLSGSEYGSGDFTFGAAPDLYGRLTRSFQRQKDRAHMSHTVEPEGTSTMNTISPPAITVLSAALRESQGSRDDDVVIGATMVDDFDGSERPESLQHSGDWSTREEPRTREPSVGDDWVNYSLGPRRKEHRVSYCRDEHHGHNQVYQLAKSDTFLSIEFPVDDCT